MSLRDAGKKQLEADAEKILRRLADGEAFRTIQREYHVGYKTFMGWLERVLADRGELRETIRRNHPARFEKGHTPWTKGVKGIHLSPATEFKAGCLRGAAARNYRPVGTITTCHDKPPRRLRNRRRKGGLQWKGKARRWIKILEDGPPKRRWITLARFNYEKQVGPIPPGCCVVHLDGNQLNDTVENLRAVTHSEAIGLQRSRDPEFEIKKQKAAGKSAKLRHETKRQIKALRSDKRFTAFWECCSCGGEVHDKAMPQQCLKCGGGSFEKRATNTTDKDDFKSRRNATHHYEKGVVL